MTKKQLRGLVDCLANICIFNTSNSYSLSLEEKQIGNYYRAVLMVFTMNSNGVFTSSDIAQLLSLATTWSVSLYFKTVNGVTVAKFL